MDDNSNSRTTTGGQAVIEDDLTNLLAQKVVGQSAATKAIVPYVYMYQSGLAPESRPAGVFLLLGPTGTGKTKTVEAIAELLHGSERKIVKIDCEIDWSAARLSRPPRDSANFDPAEIGRRDQRAIQSGPGPV